MITRVLCRSEFDDNDLYVTPSESTSYLFISVSLSLSSFLTFKSTRFAGSSSGLDAGFGSSGVWLVVAGTGCGLSGMAPDGFTSSL